MTGGNLFRTSALRDHQYGRLPIYFSNARGLPFRLRLVRAHDLQHDGFLWLTAVIPGGGLQCEGLKLFGDGAHNRGSPFVLGVNAMNGLAPHCTSPSSMEVNSVCVIASAGAG